MPIPSVTVIILKNQTVDQSLILEYDVTTVRGITSRVVIMCSSDGSGESGLNVIGEANTSLVVNNLMSFTDTYIIPQLSTADENKEHQCEVFIDAESPVTATDSVILNVTGKRIIITHALNNNTLFLNQACTTHTGKHIPGFYKLFLP